MIVDRVEPEVKKAQRWVIFEDPELGSSFRAWKVGKGWVALCEATVYTEEERSKCHVPVQGEWTLLPE